jgi:F-type H+-transporting ATPase subunit delta
MRDQLLIRRYMQGLVNAIDDQAEYEELSANLTAIKTMLAAEPELLKMLQSPFLPKSKRAAIAEEILIKMFHIKPPPEIPSIEAGAPEPFPPAKDDLSAGAKTARFFLLLIEHDRLPIFDAIMDGLATAWNEEQGIATFEVASVVELSDVQRRRLAEKLEQLEGRPVALRYTLDPSIIGGLSIRKGNIAYDVSIAGSLQRLKEQIIEG